MSLRRPCKQNDGVTNNNGFHDEKANGNGCSNIFPRAKDVRKGPKMGVKRKKGCCAKACPLLYKFFTSKPEEYRIIKGIFGFLIGFGLGAAFYYAVLKSLAFPKLLQYIIGGAFVLCFAIGFAASNQVRCILILLIPTIFGKNGRAYIGTFAIVYLMKGPVANLMLNAGEINRSISCGSELSQNLTKARAALRTQPLRYIMDDMKSQAHKIHDVTSEVQKSFKPAEVEVHDDKETMALQSKTENLDKSESDVDRAFAIDNKYRDKERSNKPEERIEAKYQKKNDFRCEDVFNLGVESCIRVFKKTERDCLRKIKVIGPLLCLPLKLTILCQLAKLIPGATGMNCEAMDAVNPGFGESFDTAEQSAHALDKSFVVNVQYKVVSNPETLTKMTADDVTQAIKYEFEYRKQWIDMIFGLFQKILAFMFLRMLWSAYSYNKEYTADFRYDNIYITSYFRHIDKRRKEENKMTLLPLKKLEEATVIRPSSLKMAKNEKSALGKSSLILVVKILIMGIIIFVDKIMYEILLIINKNSRVEYEQTGIHKIDIKVHGTGGMAHLIRTLLHGFDQEHHIEQEVSNHKCLPQPTKTSNTILISIAIVYAISWVLLIFQAYGLRLRRLVAGFFYRKREKKRVLYLYNDMLKKRKGFLRHARMIVKRRAKENKLEGEVGIFQMMAKRCRSCRCCSNLCMKFAKFQMTCLVCKEALDKKAVICSTKGCDFGYCSRCWKDIGEDCYACRNEEDWTSTDSSDHFEVV